uniref:Uncharacterized protein n=1 Tax=Megaselia scalaris TaxID=36166 RepID=T1GZC5_MEGSC
SYIVQLLDFIAQHPVLFKSEPFVQFFENGQSVTPESLTKSQEKKKNDLLQMLTPMASFEDEEDYIYEAALKFSRAVQAEVLAEYKTKSDDDDKSSGDEKKLRPVIKSAVDLQRLKLEKLMKNPEKPVVIPELPKEKDYMNSVPSFVRNVMGSSAGAGSGEFHVYRHLRRKEYARQKAIQFKSYQEEL